MSDVWLNRERQEQLLASYAPVRNAEGEIAGAVIVGTPLSDERLLRTSELTSGQVLMLGVNGGKGVELVASSAKTAAAVTSASDPAVSTGRAGRAFDRERHQRRSGRERLQLRRRAARRLRKRAPRDPDRRRAGVAGGEHRRSALAGLRRRRCSAWCW